MDIKDLSVLVLPGDELEILVEMYKPLEEVKELERLRLIPVKGLGYGISADYGLGNSLASKIISFRKANRFASLTDVSSPNSENKVSGIVIPLVKGVMLILQPYVMVWGLARRLTGRVVLPSSC